MSARQIEADKNLMEFLGPYKPIIPKPVSGGATGGALKASPSSYVRPPLSTVVAQGTSYAKPYQEAEERALKESMYVDDDEMASQFSFSSNARRPAAQLEDFTSMGSVAAMTDIDGNDLTQVYDLYNFESKHGESLPIREKKDEIILCSETNEAIVIKGFTGCGKSTQVPQYILDHYAKKKAYCNIIVTQPRRIAATSLARRVCDERDWELGSVVGYQIGLDNKTSKDTRLTYCTTSILLQKLMGTPNLNSFTHVIIDEVHERDQDMDFVLLVVRKLLRTVSRSVKVILMSATINVSHFSRYFAVPVNDQLVDVPVIELEERKSYDLWTFFLNQLNPSEVGPTPDFRMDEPGISPKTYEVCVKLIKIFDRKERLEYKNKFGHEPAESTKKHSVLVFLPGIHEIEELHALLNKETEGRYKWNLVVLHSSLSKEDQAKVFQPVRPGYRKIILSTNIAESSITVVDVRYVIDFCLTKMLVHDPLTNFSCLQLTWASKSNCEQRAGRAGRVMEGLVYRLVPETFYEQHFSEDSVPEMMRASLDQVVLKAKMLKMGEPQALLALALDPPDLGNIVKTILKLKEVGALLLTSNGVHSKYDGDITFIGRLMAMLPIDVHLTKLIVFGHMFSVLEDAIAIAACMSVQNLFNVQFNKRMEAYNSRLTWADRSSSDSVAALMAYRNYKRHLDTNVFKSSLEKEKDFARRRGLNYRALREITLLIEDITRRLYGRGISVIDSYNQVGWDPSESVVVLRIAIAGAFYPHFFLRGSSGGQIDEREAVRTLNSKDPFRTVYLKGFPLDQPGPLYAKAIKNAMNICGEKNMRLSFDAMNKVFVEFGRDKSTTRIIPGNISMAVYRAVKMRQLRIPITIPILPVEEAQKRADELRLSYKNEFMNEYSKKAVKIVTTLPGLDVSILPVVPSHVEDPNRFWVHSGPEFKLNAIMRTLNDPDELPSLTGRATVGKVYAARYPLHNPNANFFRARVDVILEDDHMRLPPDRTQVQVTFIDYGNDETINESDLREVDRDIQSVSPLCYECTLRGVKPNVATNKSEFWSNPAIERFKSKMASGKLFGEVFSVVDGVLSLDLVVKTTHGEENINEWLIEQRLANRVNESIRSLANNERRERARTYADGGTANRAIECDQESERWIPGEDVESPSRAECRNTVTLQGPFSPLETKVRGTTRATLGKETNIERDSVNSVLVDNDPTDASERLLVAASVSVSSSGSTLTLRNTTLMPSLQGLAALVTLIFAPTIELRLDPEEKRYSGCLAGLGCDPRTGEALYPENDMEVVFDCNIDKDDMTSVNNLRLCFDSALTLREGEDVTDATPAEMLDYQKKIKETLNKVLVKPRGSVEPYFFGQQFKWKAYNPNLLLEPDFTGEIFRMHSALETRSE